MLWVFILLLILSGVMSGATVLQAQPACTPQVTTKTAATISWSPPNGAAGMTFTGYVLEQQVDTGPWLALPPPPVGATTAQVTGLIPFKTYTYRLAAKGKDPAGIETISPWADPGTPAPCVTITSQPPPSGLKVTPK